MKKTILYIAASTIGFGLMLTNCSKKADPAPAATTSTTGTTTTGTTTSATTAGSTTTSTTTGSTTSATSAGSTTTSGTTTSGSGTFTIDGESHTASNVDIAYNTQDIITHVSTFADSILYSIQLGKVNLQDGTYLLGSSTPIEQDKSKVTVTFIINKQLIEYRNVEEGSVVVSGKKITITGLKLRKVSMTEIKIITVSSNFLMK